MALTNPQLIENSAPKLVPPYVPYRSFRNFIDSLKQGIPARIDRSVMSSYSGALQSQLATALRYLGLTSETGHPTEMLAVLVNTEGHTRAQALKTVLTTCYPFLFKPFDLKSATPRMVEEQFAAQGASGGTLDKCMLFFLSAAKEAGIEVSPHLKNTRGPRAQRSRNGLRRNPAVVTPASEDDFAENGAATNMSWKQMLLSKFPSFDPSWSPEVQAKWFEMFGNLMKQGEEGEGK
jgi:hypothetical protein